MKKIEKLILIMVALMFIPAVVWLLFEFISIIVYGGFNHFVLLMIGLMVYEAIVLIIMLPKIGLAAKERKDSIVSTKTKRRFRYLDSIWYRIISNQHKSGMNRVYHIIQEIDFDTIYVIDATYTNELWIDISFQSEGSFWIEEVIENSFCHDGEKMKIDKKNILDIRLKHNLKYTKEDENNVVLYHGNEELNIVQLLEQARFITGAADFDIRYSIT